MKRIAHRTRARAARRLQHAALLAWGGLAVLPAQAQAERHAALSARDLVDLSIEELASVPVTSVTGRPRPAKEAAASLFVITGEDIRRSAARSLPEALRLAPNLQVARLNANQWAISARGFNNTISNKLLVLVDGRTIYSPLYSGVFWDSQDLLLDDVERIEVISGPGATLWGANAVNGVINVITRPARDTQGLLAVAEGGRKERQLALRHGGRLADNASWRAYAMALERERTASVTGQPRTDAMRKQLAGARADWAQQDRSFTLQGEVYEGRGDSGSNLAPDLSGGHLLARWRQSEEDGSNWELQGYADVARRHDDVIFRDRTRTLDLAFNHVPALGPRHRLLWGFGHRQAQSQTPPTPLVRFTPEEKQLRWSHAFVQSEWEATPALTITGGIKAERNVYTGTEWLPTLRLSQQLDTTSTVWASASRAVRAPSRIDREFFFPADPPHIIAGGPDFRSEVARVLELGYRAQHLPGLSYSATAFWHDYERLRAGRAAPTFVENRARGRVAGVEAWGSLDAHPRWRVSGGWVHLSKSLSADAESPASSVPNLGNDPRNQWLLRSTAHPLPRVEFDLTLRHVSALPNPAVAAYTTADVRLAWRMSDAWEASLVVDNIGGEGKPQFTAADASVMKRTGYLRLVWTPR